MKKEEEEVIGRVAADKAREIRRELEGQCGVGASARAWDESKEVRVGRSEQNPQAIFSGGDRQTQRYVFQTDSLVGIVHLWAGHKNGSVTELS